MQYAAGEGLMPFISAHTLAAGCEKSTLASSFFIFLQ